MYSPITTEADPEAAAGAKAAANASHDGPLLRQLKADRLEIEAIETKVTKMMHETNSFTLVLCRLSAREVDLLRRSEGIRGSIAEIEADEDLEPGNLSDDDV